MGRASELDEAETIIRINYMKKIFSIEEKQNTSKTKQTNNGRKVK